MSIVNELIERTNTVEVTQVDVSLIDPSPYQDRKEFDEVAQAQLAASIAEYTLLQSIVVRRVAHRFELISGERRW